MIILIIILFFLNASLVSNEWNFSEKFFDRGYQLVDMCKSNNNNVYVLFSDRSVGGTQNTIVLRSTDDGNTWQEILILNPFEDFKGNSLYYPSSISCPSDDYIFIPYRNKKYVLKYEIITKNKTITKVESEKDLLELKMFDSKKGILITLFNNYITFDGWETYEKRSDFYDLKSTTTLSSAKYLKILNDNEYLVRCFSDEKYYRLVKANILNYNKEILSIIDTIDYDFPPIINEFEIINSNYIVATGSLKSGIGQSAYNLAYISTDLGKSWSKTFADLWNTPIVLANGLNSISFLDSLNGMIVGQLGSIMITNNGGFTWKYVKHHDKMDDTPTIQVESTSDGFVIATFLGGIYKYIGQDIEENIYNRYDISGKVVNNGEGVEGVKIELGDYLIFTDTNGDFSFPKMKEDYYVARPADDNYKFNPNFFAFDLNDDERNIIFDASPINSVNETPGILKEFDNKIILNNSENKINLVEIYNISGQKILDITTQNNEIKIDKTILPHGLYLLRYNYNNHSYTYKFIKE